MSTTRRTTTLTALLLGSALLAPTGASAVGETCRGEAATIVGTDFVQGTEGRDVIVAIDASEVRALGGDDLICLIAAHEPFISGTEVDAGPGNDYVDASTTPRQVRVALGAGGDQFIGSAQNDHVIAGEVDVSFIAPLLDTEPDLIDTGAGNDSIFAGIDGSANGDVLTGGIGNDRIEFAGTPTAASRADGNAGVDKLVLNFHSGSTEIDAARGTATHNGAPLAFAGFETYGASINGEAKLGFVGTAAADSLTLTGRGPVMVSADLGAGDDEFTDGSEGPATGSTIEGGSGRDKLSLTGSRIRADLGESVLLVDGRNSSVPGFEDARAAGDSVTLIGSEADNTLFSGPCNVRLVGAGGNDTLGADGGASTSNCVRWGISASGGKGRDTIEGTRSDDVLRGGNGDDVLRAGNGDDVLRGDKGDDMLRGDKDADLLLGGTGDDELLGYGADDMLRGGSGNDLVLGHGGRDTGVGGTGRDHCRTEVARGCER